MEKLEKFGLIQLNIEEARSIDGGCGVFWCADRWSYELDRAGEVYDAAVARGWENFDIHE